MTNSSVRHIRIDRALTVPVTAVFLSSSPGMYTISAPGYTSQILTGEIAEALDAYFNGTIKFPVNDNGVVDIWMGWMTQKAARNLKRFEPKMQPDWAIEPSSVETPEDSVPRPKFEEIERRIK